MTNHYGVFQVATGLFLGYLPTKAHVETFKSQRNMKSYKILKVKEKNMSKETIYDMLNNEFIISYGNIMLTLSEEEIMYQSFETLRQDIQSTLTRFVTKIEPNVKFSDVEYTTIKAFLECVYLREKEVDELQESDDEIMEHEDYYKMNLMVQEVIGLFGG